MNLVPVLGAYHRHVIDGEVLVQLVECCGSTAPAAAYNAGSRLERHTLSAGIERPVHEGAHRAADSRIVHRGAEHESVGFGSPEHKFIHDVVDGAPAKPFLTSAAAYTSGNWLAAYPEYLGGNAELLKVCRRAMSVQPCW